MSSVQNIALLAISSFALLAILTAINILSITSGLQLGLLVFGCAFLILPGKRVRHRRAPTS